MDITFLIVVALHQTFLMVVALHKIRVQIFERGGVILHSSRVRDRN